MADPHDVKYEAGAGTGLAPGPAARSPPTTAAAAVGPAVARKPLDRASWPSSPCSDVDSPSDGSSPSSEGRSSVSTREYGSGSAGEGPGAAPPSNSVGAALRGAARQWPPVAVAGYGTAGQGRDELQALAERLRKVSARRAEVERQLALGRRAALEKRSVPSIRMVFLSAPLALPLSLSAIAPPLRLSGLCLCIEGLLHGLVASNSSRRLLQAGEGGVRAPGSSAVRSPWLGNLAGAFNHRLHGFSTPLTVTTESLTVSRLRTPQAQRTKVGSATVEAMIVQHHALEAELAPLRQAAVSRRGRVSGCCISSHFSTDSVLLFASLSPSPPPFLQVAATRRSQELHAEAEDAAGDC